jgi:hypothetical protein
MDASYFFLAIPDDVPSDFAQVNANLEASLQDYVQACSAVVSGIDDSSAADIDTAKAEIAAATTPQSQALAEFHAISP